MDVVDNERKLLVPRVVNAGLAPSLVGEDDSETSHVSLTTISHSDNDRTF